MNPPRHLRADRGTAAGSRRRRRTWRQRLVLTTGCLLSMALLGAAGFATYGMLRWYGVDRVDLDLERAAEGEPINILVIGSDSRAGEGEAEQAAVPGKRTDTIIVVRLDPQADTVAALSFPRDLWLPIAGRGESGRINSAYDGEGEEQVLIDTLSENFGIPIHHWIEVDFQGFRRLVDALGGVTLYFDRALRDEASGLYVTELGCVTLDGEQALAYARSRHAEYHTEDGWVADPQSDLSRIVRQQNLMAAALDEALDQVTNPIRLRELIDIGTDSVTIDDQLGLGDIRELVDQFRDLDSDRFVTYSLPVLPRPGDEGATVVVDEAAAAPVLAVFRGGEPQEIGPARVEVHVRNGTAADPARAQGRLATEVTEELAGLGFETGPPADDPEVHEHTTVRHAPGHVDHARAVARHIDGGVVLEEDPDLEPGRVVVVAGLDFPGVRTEPFPLDDLPAPPETGRGAATTSTAAAGTSSTTATLPEPTSTTTPAQVGAVPEGAC